MKIFFLNYVTDLKRYVKTFSGHSQVISKWEVVSLRNIGLKSFSLEFSVFLMHRYFLIILSNNKRKLPYFCSHISCLIYWVCLIFIDQISLFAVVCTSTFDTLSRKFSTCTCKMIKSSRCLFVREFWEHVAFYQSYLEIKIYFRSKYNFIYWNNFCFFWNCCHLWFDFQYRYSIIDL